MFGGRWDISGMPGECGTVVGDDRVATSPTQVAGQILPWLPMLALETALSMSSGVLIQICLVRSRAQRMPRSR